MMNNDDARQLIRDIREIFRRLDDLETNPFSLTGGAVPPAGTLYNHLEDNGAAWASVTNLTFADDATLGLPVGGNIQFDSSPAPNQLVFNSLDLNLFGNDIHVQDNIADGFTLYDDGGVPINYLRLVTTDAQPVIDFNAGGVDVDFHVRAFGVADALQVQGSDGQIILGALGVGFVQSDAGGVLSSAAIGAGDLPVHTHSGAADGGSLVIGTTDTDATSGSVLFAGAAGGIQQDNANLFWDDGNNELGIGTAAPDGTLHVHTASAGAVAPVASADDLVIENSGGAAGLSILSPDAGFSQIAFGSPSNNQGATLIWDYSSDKLVITTNKVGAKIDFQTDAAAAALTLQSSGEADFVEYLRHFGDTDTFWRFQTDQATLECGGVTFLDAVEAATDYLSLMPAATGNVGVATITPQFQLSVTGDIFVYKTSSDPQLRFGVGNTEVAPTQGWNIRIDDSDADKFKIRDITNAREVMTFDTSGNVGIQAQSPGSLMEWNFADDDLEFVDAHAASAVGSISGVVEVQRGGATEYIALYDGFTP